jgi:hypothetical protein
LHSEYGPSWLWSYSSWIYNYLCNQCLSPLKLWVRIPLMKTWSLISNYWTQKRPSDLPMQIQDLWIGQGIWLIDILNEQIQNRVRVFNATFNNTSVVSHFITLSHNFVSSTPRHERDSNSQMLVVISTDCIGRVICLVQSRGPGFALANLMVFFVFNNLKWEIRFSLFVDIGRIVDHHCLNTDCTGSCKSNYYMITTMTVHIQNAIVVIP